MAGRIRLRVEPADQDRDVRPADRVGDPRLPRRVVREEDGHGGLGPRHQPHARQRFRLRRHPQQLQHQRGILAATLLLLVADVGLDHRDRGDRHQDRRPLAPDAIGERRGQRHGHRHHGPPPAPAQRQHQQHVHPGQPERDAARAGQVGPLDQRRHRRERGAEPEPREADLAHVPDPPLDGRPQQREDRPQRQPRAAPHPDRRPGGEGPPRGQDQDGGGVSQRRQRREVPQRHHDPVEDQPVREQADPEPQLRATPRPCVRASVRPCVELPEERHERDERRQDEAEGRIGGEQQNGGRRRRQEVPPVRQPARDAHSLMSCCSSAER